MKLKIIVKVSMHDDKTRSKALKTVVGLSGVVSAGLIGADKDQIEIIGEGIDCVELTCQLRKKVGRSELVSVGEDKKEEPKPPAKVETPAIQESTIGWYFPPTQMYNYPNYHCIELRDNHPGCTIM